MKAVRASIAAPPRPAFLRQPAAPARRPVQPPPFRHRPSRAAPTQPQPPPFRPPPVRPQPTPPVPGSPAPARSLRAAGAIDALPIVVGYLPVAFAFGMLAASAHLPFWAAAGMSTIVFAGGSQFVAVSLLGAGAPVWTVLVTTFIVNFRHFLMSAAIASRLRAWPRPLRVAFGLQLTDECFAVHLNSFATLRPEPSRVFVTNALPHSAWILGTILGHQASGLFPDVKAFGLDFALAGMFICLVFFQLKDRWVASAGLIAAASALALKLAGAGHAAVLLASILAATTVTAAETFAESVRR